MRGFVRMLVFIGFAIACSDIAFAQQTMDAQIASLIDQIKKKANLKLDPTTTQVAIDTETYELRHLSDPALIAAVDEDGANALVAKQLANAKSPFSNPRFTFSKQVIEATLDYKSNVSVPVAGPVDVDAELRAQLSPTVAFANDSPNAEFKVRVAVAKLDVSSLKLSRNGKPLNAIENGMVEALASGLLIPAQVLLNHVEFHIPTIVPAKIDLHPIEKGACRGRVRSEDLDSPSPARRCGLSYRSQTADAHGPGRASCERRRPEARRRPVRCVSRGVR